MLAALILSGHAAASDEVATFTSASPVFAKAVGGTVTEQIATLNSGLAAGPFTQTVLMGQDYCSGCQDVPGAPEISLDNQSSAFYLFEFLVPKGAVDPVMTITISTDDQGVAFVNGTRVSALMTSQFNWGSDAVDGAGLPILTWPTSETLIVDNDPVIFTCGSNQLLIGLCGNCSSDPTGFEFTASLRYSFDEMTNPADVNGDGFVDGADLGLLLSFWGKCDECAADLDCNHEIDGGDLGLLLASWTG